MRNQILVIVVFFCSALMVCTTANACPDRSGLLDVNCDGEVNVITFGDSITYGIGDEMHHGGYPGRLSAMFPEVIFHNAGDPGERTAVGVNRAPRVFADIGKADFIIVLEGVNDYFDPNKSPVNTKTRLLRMISSGANTGALTILMNLTDVRRSFQKGWVSSVNREIRPYRNVDLYSLGDRIIGGDLLHPNGGGYQSMADLIAPVLVQMSNDHRPADSDHDGIYDWAEARFGTDPTNPDTDGDTIPDGEEVFVYGSSPISLDTDNDGLSDVYEIRTLHSNPADARPGAPHIRSLSILMPSSS